MIDWIVDNWHYVLIVLSSISIIFNIIILCIKKVPLIKILKVIKLIPDLINQAETMFPVHGYGTTKRDIVKALFNNLLYNYGLEKFSKYIDIDSLIEDFLKTPTKKEVE